MTDIKTFLEATGYKISEVSPYQWHCFGEGVVALEVDNDANSLYSAGVVFSLVDQTVYQMYVHDYVEERAYRYCNPKYHDAYLAEVGERQVDDCAWDFVRYLNLEVEEDFIGKMKAIMNGEEYSDDVMVQVDLEDDLVFQLMLRAHKEDCTLNQLVNKILREYINKFPQ